MWIPFLLFIIDMGRTRVMAKNGGMSQDDLNRLLRPNKRRFGRSEHKQVR